MEKRAYKCYECNHVFSTEKSVFDHLRSFHQIRERVVQIKCVNNFISFKCSHTFLTFNGLRKHLDRCYSKGKTFDEEVRFKSKKYLIVLCDNFRVFFLLIVRIRMKLK